MKRTRNYVLLAALTAFSAVIVVGALMGLRWFMVETPSMGTAAPRGSLVITQQVKSSSLSVGQIISFHPPTSPDQTYTHRIATISANGITTRGDINGAPDGWDLHSSDIIGRAVVIIPAAGWLLKLLPLLSVGLLLVWSLAQLIRNIQVRKTLRAFASSMVFTYAITNVKPFASFAVMGATPSDKGGGLVDYSVVNTGLLPMGFRSADGSSFTLNDGQVGVVHAVVNQSTNFVDLGAHMVLGVWQWGFVFIVGAIPMLISIHHFLKSRREAKNGITTGSPTMVG